MSLPEEYSTSAAQNTMSYQPPYGDDTSSQKSSHPKIEDLSKDTMHQIDATEAAQAKEEPDTTAPAREVQGLRWLVVCVSLYVTCFLYGLDTTIAADLQSAIIERFGHVDQLAWIGAGFPLGSVAVILPLGSFYNYFDMKWIFILSVLFFEGGSALCGGAPTMSALIVGRVIAGAGGSGIFLGVLNFFAALTTPKERGFYVNLIGSCWGIGAVLGPVIGGAFSSSSATWRWGFYINLVIGAAAAPVYLLCLPSVKPVEGRSVRERLAPLDFVGFTLGAGVWVSFLLALTMAGGQWHWNDGRTIATFVVFGLVLVLYVLQQYFAIFTTQTRRAFPGHLLRSRTQVLLYIATSSGITALYVLIYFIPIYFQFVNGDNAIMAAVRLLPSVIVAITINLLSGVLLSVVKIYMLMFLTSGVFLTIGGALLTTYLTPDTSTSTIYGLTVVVAIGCGLAMLLGYSVSTLTTKAEDTGAGLAMQNVAQIGGQVIALAIAGQVFQSTAVRSLSSALAGQGFSQAEITGAVAGAQSALLEDLSGELREEAIRAITRAMQTTFVLVPVAGGVMLLAALCMKREKLFGKVPVAAG